MSWTPSKGLDLLLIMATVDHFDYSLCVFFWKLIHDCALSEALKMSVLKIEKQRESIINTFLNTAFQRLKKKISPRYDFTLSSRTVKKYNLN